jgi:hypothetical protein
MLLGEQLLHGVFLIGHASWFGCGNIDKTLSVFRTWIFCLSDTHGMSQNGRLLMIDIVGKALTKV